MCYYTIKMENFFPTHVYPPRSDKQIEADNRRHRLLVQKQKEALEKEILKMKQKVALYVATPCSKLGNGYCICGKGCFFQPSKASGC